MARILVIIRPVKSTIMITSGGTIASDIQRNINHYHNIGDAFVFNSSLKLLNFEKLDFARD